MRQHYYSDVALTRRVVAWSIYCAFAALAGQRVDFFSHEDPALDETIPPPRHVLEFEPTVLAPTALIRVARAARR